MTPNETPLYIILFLIFCIILPLLAMVIGLTNWPNLGSRQRVGVILLAVLVLVASFAAPILFP